MQAVEEQTQACRDVAAVKVDRAWEIARGRGEPPSADELEAISLWLASVYELRDRDPDWWTDVCERLDEVGQACRVVFGGPMTKEARTRLHRTVPGFATVTATELITAGRHGYRGDAAVRFALRTRHALSAPASVALASVVRSARPREHRAGPRQARAPGDADDGPEPPVDPRAPRPCLGCGTIFRPARAAQTYCTAPGCRRARKRVLRAAERQTAASQSPAAALDRLDRLIGATADRLVTRGELTLFEAVALCRRHSEIREQVVTRGDRLRRLGRHVDDEVAAALDELGIVGPQAPSRLTAMLAEAA